MTARRPPGDGSSRQVMPLTFGGYFYASLLPSLGKSIRIGSAVQCETEARSNPLLPVPPPVQRPPRMPTADPPFPPKPHHLPLSSQALGS